MKNKYTKQKNISIVIPTLNEEKYLSGILKDLTKQKKSFSEIIIVDGQSLDKTIQVATRYQKKLPIKIYVTKKGVSCQRNYGANRATGDWLIFFDADTRLEKKSTQESTSIDDLVELIEKKQALLACPKFVPETNHVGLKLLFRCLYFLFKIGQYRFPAGAGPCIIINKHIFDTHSGFLPEFLFEDLEYIHRMGKIYPYRVLDVPVYVSDRRFKKLGYWRTIYTYIILSTYFISGKLSHKAQEIKYPFSIHHS